MEVEAAEVGDEGEAGRVRSPYWLRDNFFGKKTDLVKLDPELYSRFQSNSKI